MKSFKLESSLRFINSKSPSIGELGGINVQRLLSLGLIKKVVNKEKRFKIPEDAPRWAAKYKFTRKKYKVAENIESKEFYTLTSKGKRKLRNLKSSRLKADEEEEEDNLG